MAEDKKFKRVVLKLSGEAMAGAKGFGIDPDVVDSLAAQIQDVVEQALWKRTISIRSAISMSSRNWRRSWGTV